MLRPQHTLAGEAHVTGVAFFTGGDVRVTFRPAPAGAGVTFVRSDLPGRPIVPALIEQAVELHRRTGVARGAADVQLTEHVLAATAGLHVDNCVIELDGPELPGLDGSAVGFADALARCGVVPLPEPRPVIRLHEELRVEAGGAAVVARPIGEADIPRWKYRLDCGPGHPVPPQSYAWTLAADRFAAEIAPARTFIAAAEIPALRAAGYGDRVKTADLLVFEPDGAVRGNAPRFSNEPARHKLLDLIGDLVLLGADLHADVTSTKGGHALNRALCRVVRDALVGGRASFAEGTGVSPSSGIA